jgi:Mg2+ and Co2+ transporter CorA
MDSCPILFGTIFILWSLAYRYRGFWFGFWYSLHFNLLSFLRTSNESPSSNLVFNLLFGTDNATELPENMAEQELQIRARFQLILLLTAKDPLQQSISCLSEELSEARYRAQASPSSGKHLLLLAFRRTLANFGVQIAKAKEYATLYNHSIEYSQQPPKRSIASTIQGLEVQLDRMNKDLKEETQLIIGAVTVQDADLARQQSERATLLALLAAIYLPLSLVTRIFGMDIREIDDRKPQFCWCIVVMVVMSVLP